MARSPLNITEISEEFSRYSTKGQCHQFPDGTKGMPYLAFVFSIFIYTSVYYAFDISPSTLFSNTKFWFIISNTLILIIAADYGAFSSQKKKQPDFYEEYSTQRSRPRPVWEAAAAAPMAVYVREVNDEEKPQEKTVQMVEPENGEEGKEKVALEDGPSEKSEGTCNEGKTEGGINDREDESSNDRSTEEDNSVSEENDEVEEEKRVIMIEERKGDGSEECDERNGEESDEFSAMSDEELNRRVEEFILKLKRQIRLQGVRQLGWISSGLLLVYATSVNYNNLMSLLHRLAVGSLVCRAFEFESWLVFSF